METIEIKAYVPARDISMSSRFYADLGFTVVRDVGGHGLRDAGHCSFLLQKFQVKEHAENFMMHMLVTDVGAWWERVVSQDLAGGYDVRAIPRQDQWGIRDFCIADPTSVLCRIGQNIG